MKKFFLLLLIATLPLGSFAQEARFAKIDSLLNHFYANNKFMGSIAIREKNKVVFAKAYGYADLENNTKATPQTKYKIGSITKMFTAAMIFQLIEEKKLKLDTKLSEFFPEFKNANKINIASLLNHKSGIYNYTNDPEAKDFVLTYHSKANVIKKLAAYEPAFEPDTKAEYSNSNYILLGYIIETVGKKPYKGQVMDRIVNKIGLKDTYYYSKINPKKREAFSYSYKGGKWEKREEWHESFVFAAGALQSTPSDLTQFIKALFDGKIISKASLAEMTKMDMGYGKGIVNFSFGERKFLGHNGGIEGFSSVLGYYPKDELSIALTINGENYDTNDMVIGILSCYYKLPYRFPNLNTVEVDDAVLESYEGVYASPTVPLKLTIRAQDGKLSGQATGQGPFPLSALSTTEFIFDGAGINIKFRKDAFTIKQGGTSNEFTREK
ncbi:MAG: class A beta-lactamase-related serine hydrolase [Flavobacterium sp.]|nr:MAG: class A beta-lactamase-related serine hydrolase [Flavobacterium sp.]